jgi:hypothetical protein
MKEIVMSHINVTGKMLRIASIITHGDLADADLSCPICKKGKLIFSFTVIEAPRYGLYIVCRNCRRVIHYSLGEKPPNFREELVIDEYQRLEDEAHAKSLAKGSR